MASFWSKLLSNIILWLKIILHYFNLMFQKKHHAIFGFNAVFTWKKKLQSYTTFLQLDRWKVCQSLVTWVVFLKKGNLRKGSVLFV